MATDNLSRTFSALADPTRRAILARLSLGEASVGDIAAPFAMSLPAISKHLRVLESAGLISRGVQAQWRPASLRAQPLANAADWIEDYRRFWERSFDQLDEHLETMKRTLATPSTTKKITPTKDTEK
jgi:DNA-binding transcriptional ArsR family regulator